jgi:K+-sensing histidine kinase KdpD
MKLLEDEKYVSLKFSEPEIRERNRDLGVLMDISSLLPASSDMSEFLNGSIRKVTEHFRLAAGRIYLLDEGGQSLQLAASTGIDTESFERVKITEGFSGKAVRTRSFLAQRVSELEDPERVRFLETKGLKIVICVPLIVMGKIVGVMNLGGKEEITLTQAMVDLLGAIGNHIAVAVSSVGLLEEITRRAEEIQEKNETIRFLAHSVTHDLKGPTIAIHGLVKRLQDIYAASLDERGRAYCEQILSAAGQVMILVQHLNEYMYSKEAPLRPEPISLKEVIEEIRTEFAERLASRNIRWQVPEEMPTITADRLSVFRILRNIVENSLKYGGEGLSEIRIVHRRDENLDTLCVSDDGVGVKGAGAESLFKLFHRERTSKGTQGSGLGLAIVKELAERHGGRAWVEDGRQEGATFCFSLAREKDGRP